MDIIIFFCFLATHRCVLALGQVFLYSEFTNPKLTNCVSRGTNLQVKKNRLFGSSHPAVRSTVPKRVLFFIFHGFLIWSISRRSGGRRRWQWWDMKRGVWDLIGGQRCRGSQEQRERIYRRVVHNVWLDATLLPRDWPKKRCRDKWPLTLTLEYL